MNQYHRRRKKYYRVFNMMLVPEIFMPNSSDNELINILVEKYDGFEIFWYHWPHDGDVLLRRFFGEEDYEPIILLYDVDGSFIGLVTRPHWKYRDYYLNDGLDTPPKILFENEFHPPYPRTDENNLQFDEKIIKMISSDLIPIVIESSRIMEKFRSGKGHRTNYKFKKMDDPVSVAQQLIDDYDAKL